MGVEKVTWDRGPFRDPLVSLALGRDGEEEEERKRGRTDFTATHAEKNESLRSENRDLAMSTSQRWPERERYNRPPGALHSHIRMRREEDGSAWRGGRPGEGE